MNEDICSLSFTSSLIEPASRRAVIPVSSTFVCVRERSSKTSSRRISWNGKWKKVHVNIQINEFMKG